ncbi:2462_t:CDS:2 [Paraglomus brasilianum]|uniref:non-specific serine/threonine protein kinase n=1 Tax=Paraglomus brasilianum TaxID=144538 RepID=A0A9N9CMZ8_9GLOM|nr:2462_t:CDS:2 [Paraglomus brasilianum]
MSKNLIKQGAEARVYTTPFLTRAAIAKERFRKTYRHPLLDKKLTDRRLVQEARCLVKCRNIGVDVPAVYFVDLENRTIYMEYIEGKTVNDLLADGAAITTEESDELAKKIGEALAKMHAAEMIHGDLTTSNLMIRDVNKSLAIIDFGLSFITSCSVEDKAVDLYVLEKTFLSTHPHAHHLFLTILKVYGESYNNAKSVLRKLDEGK